MIAEQIGSAWTVRNSAVSTAWKVWPDGRLSSQEQLVVPEVTVSLASDGLVVHDDAGPLRWSVVLRLAGTHAGGNGLVLHGQVLGAGALAGLFDGPGDDAKVVALADVVHEGSGRSVGWCLLLAEDC